MATKRAPVSNEELAERLERVERKLDDFMRAKADEEEDAEDSRLVSEAYAEQGDRPLVPHDEFWRRVDHEVASRDRVRGAGAGRRRRAAHG